MNVRQISQRPDGLAYVGRETTPYTGRLVDYQRDGRKKVEIHFVDGLIAGLETKWYANGNRKSEITWQAGRKTGPYRMWYESGKQQGVGMFLNGVRDGAVTEWDEEGRKVTEGRWKEGKFSGVITEREEGGRKLTSYVYRDGMQEDVDIRYDPTVLAEVDKVREERTKLDSTLWKPEVLAQKHEEVFVTLWDELREAKDKYEPLVGFSFGSLFLPRAKDSQNLEWGIRSIRFGDPTRELKLEGWKQFLWDWKKRGLRIIETEWHHGSFSIGEGERASSVVSMTIHALNSDKEERHILRGKLRVEWDEKPSASAPHPERIVVEELQILSRKGPVPFQESLVLRPDRNDPSIRARAEVRLQPLLLYDLDRDGLSEVISARTGTIHWNRGNGLLVPEPMVFQENAQGSGASLREYVRGALVADLTGDGRPDLFLVQDEEPLLVFPGRLDGRFAASSIPSPIAKSAIRGPTVCTAGDIDGDGDLDIWIAQYKPPYQKGQFPTPYYDANDGFPSYLFINNGKGEFTEGTKQAGLEKKRHRRAYSSSFIDLDDDEDLDLVVVSDFSGLDLYHNDGKGHFTDVTEKLGDERFSFGMSHAFSDFNGDGRPDLFMTGMGSTTARRIAGMKLGRKDFPGHQEHRMKMGYGNRLFLSGEKGLKQAPYNDQVARTGWAWGTTAFDFDNDGDKDLYVANGHLSRKTCKDYCTIFWRHDIYTANSKEDLKFTAFFNKSQGILQDISWNGFEHNNLLMNEGNKGFRNVAFLMNLSQEYDSRAVVSDDIDADGRMDLLVVESGWDRASGNVVESIHLNKNQWMGDHHWVGVRLYEHGEGFSPVGAKVAVSFAGRKQVAHIVTGDSFHSQHANTQHFGLGSAREVDHIEVHWPNGKTSRIEKPAIDRYHVIKPL